MKKKGQLDAEYNTVVICKWIPANPWLIVFDS